VNCSTSYLLEKTDISVLRGKDKVKLLSLCRLSKVTREVQSQQTTFSECCFLEGVVESGRRKRAGSIPKIVG
jgi:hypothetical protein